MMITNVAILGATGSVGGATLDVIARHPERFRVWAVTGHHQVGKLADIARVHQPQVVGVTTGQEAAFESCYGHRCAEHSRRPEVVSGTAGLEAIAACPEVDTVVAAIAGAAGLPSVASAIGAGKRVLIANKEPLVMMVRHLMSAATEAGALVLPVDSEHNAIFQCLPRAYRNTVMGQPPQESNDTAGGRYPWNVAAVTLTASGGPFLNTPIEMLAEVTPTQAAKHPNWSMGRKISIDSATMMNKALELIEACVYFSLPPSAVQILIHPQSIVHSLVEFDDKSVLAQMAVADMRVPIANALAYPERIASGAATLDLAAIGSLDFLTPDRQRFPCLDLARVVATAGGTAPAVLNAANEVAVEEFCEGKIRFTDIVPIVEETVDRIPFSDISGIQQVLDADARARTLAKEVSSRHRL